ncbi:MAG: hypothetical protein HY277_05290 [Ignavibacteriales bacterium]|nr:hypothetical protein [Ignavibacteriales bacterium]
MKQFAIVAVLVVAMGSIALSQAKPGGIARQVAMGGSQAGTGLVLNPFIMDDPAVMLVNPAYQAMYKDYGWSNVAGGGLTGLSTAGGPIGNDGYGHQSAGIAFGLNSDWNLGAILSYDPSAVNFVNTLISNSSGLFPASIVRSTNGRFPQGIPPVANVWEVVISNHMSSADWGFGVMYGWSNTDTKATAAGPPASSGSSEASSNVWGFRAGVNVPFGSGNSFDASASLRLDKANDKKSTSPIVAANTGDFSASGTEFQVNARAKFNVSSKFNFIPYGTLVTVSAEPKEDVPPSGLTATTVSEKASVLAYAVGAGGEYKTSTFYFAGGVSWQSARIKAESTAPPTPTATTTATYTALPVFNLGGEWWFTDWLAGRAGYYRSIGNFNLKTESASGTFEGNLTVPNSAIAIGAISPTNLDGMVTLGVGFKFGGAAIDATVSEEALRRGLGLIGASDNINTFGYMTASYYFGE